MLLFNEKTVPDLRNNTKSNPTNSPNKADNKIVRVKALKNLRVEGVIKTFFIIYLPNKKVLITNTKTYLFGYLK